VEQSIYFVVGDRTPQSDVIYVDNRNQHSGATRHDAEMEKSTRRPENCLFFNFFYNRETVVWVNDLVANLK
jgi:hypothetical protein